MIKNLFTHLESTLNFQIKLLGKDGNPLDLDNVDIKFGVAHDATSETLEVLTLANGISIIDPIQSIVEISFSPKKANGFNELDLIYQVQVTVPPDAQSYIAQEGRIFITASLFD